MVLGINDGSTDYSIICGSALMVGAYLYMFVVFGVLETHTVYTDPGGSGESEEREPVRGVSQWEVS